MTKRNKLHKLSQTSFSSIVALVYISESELARVMPSYSSEWEVKYPEMMEEILWGLGLNTKQPYKRYDTIQHRNRFDEVVMCSRWVGNERHDFEWISSGYASKEALDRDRNSRLLDDTYRMRGLTQDIQDLLESRDRYFVEE